jgi:hypothetical protein
VYRGPARKHDSVRRLGVVEPALVLLLVFSPNRGFGEDRLPVVFEQEGLVPQAKLFLTERASEVQAWASAKSLVDAVIAQNRTPETLDETRKLDRNWIEGKSAPGFEDDLLSNDCATTLRGFVASASKESYREAFLTDARGALVCETERTSDYWQGDETKWIRAFNDGHGAIYIGPVTLDASVGQPLVQIAVPVLDGGKAIGVLIVGKLVRDLEHGRKLERRRDVE